MQEILMEYDVLVKDDLHSRLPQERNVAHEILIEYNGKPTQRPLFQLSS